MNKIVQIKTTPQTTPLQFPALCSLQTKVLRPAVTYRTIRDDNYYGISAFLAWVCVFNGWLMNYFNFTQCEN